MSDTLAERVARGAAFLDEKQPGWEFQVDLYRLRMSRGVPSRVEGVVGECGCVMVHLSSEIEGGSYLSGCDKFGIPPFTSVCERLGGIELGLTLDSEEDEPGVLFTNRREWQELDDLWTSTILARRGRALQVSVMTRPHFLKGHQTVVFREPQRRGPALWGSACSCGWRGEGLYGSTGAALDVCVGHRRAVSERSAR